eukprot:TRINITY_DN6177_c0_g1_i4.p2 TRINITY_DN6177_c0_g1~~TRINITY_DN6177_c0_g1_i4.p2  ORF type:complete len:101 (+),score=20.85 TRINITY_DN6177_c0_g1_i4:153-455(+)
MPPKWLLSRSPAIEWVIYSPKKDKQEETIPTQPKVDMPCAKQDQTSKRGKGKKQSNPAHGKWNQSTLQVYYKEQSSGGGSAPGQGSSGQRAPEAQSSEKK